LIFLAKVLGVGGSMSDSISVTIDSMADPIAYFSQQMERELIDLRVSNATVRAKKGANRIVGCTRVKDAERQQGYRFLLPAGPSTLPGYLDGRWPGFS